MTTVVVQLAPPGFSAFSPPLGESNGTSAAAFLQPPAALILEYDAGAPERRTIRVYLDGA